MAQARGRRRTSTRARFWGVVQVPAPLRAVVTWRPGVTLAPALRERVTRELEDLSWEISQAEALLHDAVRVAGHDRAWLMPRIELRLPLFEENRRFRLLFSHVEKARILLVDEDAKRLADVVIV